jgi:hypothetical protein
MAMRDHPIDVTFLMLQKVIMTSSDRDDIGDAVSLSIRLLRALIPELERRSYKLRAATSLSELVADIRRDCFVIVVPTARAPLPFGARRLIDARRIL